VAAARHCRDKICWSHQLCRTFRAGARVLHETAGNISHLPAELIDLTRRALAGEKCVPATAAFRVVENFPHGHVQAVLGTARRLGLDSVITSKPCLERNLVLAMVTERLLYPCSKLATTRLWHAKRASRTDSRPTASARRGCGPP
jgi:hypothetical protein